MPQGEYDSDMTAFVQLPQDGSLDAPLAAPGHGFVPPPMIMPLTSTADTAPTWPEPEPRDPHDPHATAQWTFPDVEHPTHGGAPDGPVTHGETAHGETHAETSELTGQWTIPLAQGDLPEESGEFSPAALESQWGGHTPPATLPGGAPAPWAEPAGATEAPAHESAPEPGGPGSYPSTLPGGAPAPWAAAVEAAEQESTETKTGAAEPEGTGEPADQPEAEVAEVADADAPAFDDHDAAAAAPALSTLSSDEHPHTSYVLRVNGADRPVTDAWVGESLLYVLRERLGLAGAKDGCSQGECGACNVQVDGRLVASCLVPAATAAGSEVRTVEGLAVDGEPSDVQRALASRGAVQCGFCIPGMAMTVHDLLAGNHAPTELETRQALCGNLCRCSGYRGVLDAVREVVAEREAAAAEASGPAGEAVARIPHQAPPGAGSVQPHPHDGGMA
ncbi:2Fe-2S iron-sulfur cluster-binding protein [Streptomyces sp. NPDC019396]|uniref:(2Fe-2S)-binding protein n=1 Tax=Streptomyces sp. NPDC019396 TaxID=3154687 RepID=UPI0033F06A2C